MTSSLEDEVTRVVAGMDEAQNSQEQQVPGATEQEQEAQETIHIHYFPDAIVILKEEDEAKVVHGGKVVHRGDSVLGKKGPNLIGIGVPLLLGHSRWCLFPSPECT